ncbi:xylosyltransferase oxt [Acyrthosiphon pisum]|uniref:protein xylosyltransferase n=1 Tax=Acyrthosiphon pisum TaxID=7029 RepID=A0A8R2A2Z2_ACYPI|nr:xylosyltransferase oxt [Acyrthosiphon pisum]|eukprot:XP_001949441.1 PREDICTED: xylosyltransferase oxt isoform X2 [Acyrthosiphon pisum]
MDIKWLKRYRLFCIGGTIILCVQVALAFVFFSIQEYSVVEELSPNSLHKLRNVADYGIGDDEESSYNNVPSGSNHRNKLPPDKDNSASSNEYFNKALQQRHSNYKTDNYRVLGIDELGFVPPCDISGRECVSALHRAKTETCKQIIANISCLIKTNPPYPKRLPHQCPTNDVKKNKIIGCFRDGKEIKLLPGYKTTLIQTNSQDNCVDLCLQSGFAYAGVEYGTECFCGNETPEWGLKLPDTFCDMQCPGNQSQMCGGHYTINVFKTGVSKFIAKVASEPSPNFKHNNTPPVRIVFLLTLNGRAVRQVYRLIKALFHRDHYFFIHVDSRHDYMFRELLKIELALSNIRLSRRRHSTIWGGASLLTTLMDAMSDLVESSWDWDFVINLSESDFPIKSNDALVKFLTMNREHNFVKSHGREVQQFIQKQGLDKTFVECEARMWRVGEKELPKGIIWDGGSDWLALSRPFVDYLVAGDTLISGLSQFFKYTLLPAESFFHTVLRNSPFCETYIDNNLHVTNWKRWLGCKCQYRHVVDWCGCSPNVFRYDDWNRIKNTEKKQVYFARKFEPIINLSIIDTLEVWLYGEYPADFKNRMSYWQNVYHHEDIHPAPDESLLIVGTSLARVATKYLTTSHTTCQIRSLDKLRQVFTYHHKDQFKGFLIQYEVSFSNSSTKLLLESWCWPKLQGIIIHNRDPINRLLNFVVSSDFDKKEQMSRNFIRLISPYTEPVLIHQWATGEQRFTVTFLWLNPYDELVNITPINIEESALVTFSKPILPMPLSQGIWTILLVYENVTMAYTQFLVTPSQTIKDTSVPASQMSFINKAQNYKQSLQDWENVIKAFKNSIVLETKNKFIDRTKTKMTSWIDSLIKSAYNIIETCIVVPCKTLNDCGLKELVTCAETSWSSYSPDPKSDIKSINKESGTLNRY